MSSTVRRLIHHVSGGKQFCVLCNREWTSCSVDPNWSGDNLRGVGMGHDLPPRARR